MQQRIRPGRGVVHAEALVDDLGDARQRPTLVVPAPGGRPGIEHGLKFVELSGAEPAARPARALGGQRRAASARRQPHPFPPGVLFGGQPATIGIPHATGIAQAAPTVSGVWNLRR